MRTLRSNTSNQRFKNHHFESETRLYRAKSIAQGTSLLRPAHHYLGALLPSPSRTKRGSVAACALMLNEWRRAVKDCEEECSFIGPQCRRAAANRSNRCSRGLWAVEDRLWKTTNRKHRGAPFHSPLPPPPPPPPPSRRPAVPPSLLSKWCGCAMRRATAGHHAPRRTVRAQLHPASSRTPPPPPLERCSPPF